MCVVANQMCVQVNQMCVSGNLTGVKSCVRAGRYWLLMLLVVTGIFTPQESCFSRRASDTRLVRAQSSVCSITGEDGHEAVGMQDSESELEKDSDSDESEFEKLVEL